MAESCTERDAVVDLAVMKLTRLLLGAGCAVVLGTTAASCVGVLSLDGYTGAGAALCALLTSCYGSDSFPSCDEHVASGLETASPQVRSAWLTLFGEQGCLDSCTKARGCLDVLPICHQAGAICSQQESCCGFLNGEGSCDTDAGSCCVPDGLSCVGGEPCCSSCSQLTGTCGGAVCKTEGEGCTKGEECCSENCDEQGHCSFRCREPGEDCAQPTDCCSQQCQDGHCGCSGEGAGCTLPEQCCDKLCVEGKCSTAASCQTLGKDCEQEACCLPLTCHHSAKLCCYPNLSTCSLSLGCCSQSCVGGVCCAKLSGRCSKNEECCVGHCVEQEHCECNKVGEECDDPADCCEGSSCYAETCQICIPTGCHSICVIGPPLSPSANGTVICVGPNAPSSECVSEICQEQPLCCCTSWSDECVVLGKKKTNEANSACYKSCK